METVYDLNSRGMGNHKQKLFQDGPWLLTLQCAPLHRRPGEQPNKALKVNICHCFSWLEASLWILKYKGCDVKQDLCVKRTWTTLMSREPECELPSSLRSKSNCCQGFIHSISRLIIFLARPDTVFASRIAINLLPCFFNSLTERKVCKTSQQLKDKGNKGVTTAGPLSWQLEKLLHLLYFAWETSQLNKKPWAGGTLHLKTRISSICLSFPFKY